MRNARAVGMSGLRALWIVGLAVLALAWTARSALSQDVAERFDVHGVVTDEAGRALVGAWVGLTGSDWGAVSDANGRFRLPDQDEGRLELTVEQLGYDTLSWSGQVNAQTGPIHLTMTARPLVLEGLTVVTDRFESRRRATATSVRTLDRATLATSHERDVWRLLQARAGLASARCPARSFSSICIWSRGRVSTAQVYIDEMPVVGGIEYLQAFRPHELYMVEVYARGRHIRAYTNQFMERAARTRLAPIPFVF